MGRSEFHNHRPHNRPLPFDTNREILDRQAEQKSVLCGQNAMDRGDKFQRKGREALARQGKWMKEEDSH